MNHRSSLHDILRFKRPAEVCQFEWGYWPETLARWRQEGMAGDNPWDELPITFYHRVPVETRLCPEFAFQILEENETTRIVRDGMLPFGRLGRWRFCNA